MRYCAICATGRYVNTISLISVALGHYELIRICECKFERIRCFYRALVIVAIECGEEYSNYPSSREIYDDGVDLREAICARLKVSASSWRRGIRERARARSLCVYSIRVYVSTRLNSEAEFGGPTSAPAPGGFRFRSQTPERDNLHIHDGYTHGTVVPRPFQLRVRFAVAVSPAVAPVAHTHAYTHIDKHTYIYIHTEAVAHGRVHARTTKFRVDRIYSVIPGPGAGRLIDPITVCRSFVY